LIQLTLWRNFTRRRAALGALSLVLLPGLAVGLYLAFLQLSGNFHEVVAGELYRSAQLTPEGLAAVVRSHGIRTVINLRGASPRRDWYRGEIDEARRLGLTHVDFAMSAARPLTSAEANTLIRVMAEAPKPILIHCRSGADRTGLVAALYVAAIKKGSERSAEAQFSPAYGHFSIPFTGAYAMDRTFEMMEPQLGYSGS
jgi:protein tyrosine/serine phosphatase